MNVPLRAPGAIGTWGSRRATRGGFESLRAHQKIAGAESALLEVPAIFWFVGGRTPTPRESEGGTPSGIRGQRAQTY